MSHWKLIFGIFCGFLLVLPSKILAFGEEPPPVAAVPLFQFSEAYTLSNSVVVPFDLLGRLILVRASAKGEEGNFILDTGADKLVLNRVYFGVGENLISSNVGGMTGSVAGASRTKLNRFDWDQFGWEKVRADIIDLSHIERSKNTKILGLIGFEMIEELEVFIDYEKKLLILSKLDKEGNLMEPNDYFGNPIDSLDLRIQSNVILIKGRVDNHKVIFSLDSGAEVNVLDRNIKRKVLNNFEISKRVELIGTGQKKIEVLAGKLYKVKLGNLNCAGMLTLLSNLDEIRATSGVFMDGVLGYEFLANQKVSINCQKGKLYFFGKSTP